MSSFDQHVYNNIQDKIMSSRRQLANVDSQLTIQYRESRKNEITKSELEALPNSTETYLSVGKMFSSKPKDSIIADLEKQTKLTKATYESLTKKKKFLEKELKDASDSLKDFIHHSTRLQG
ncbi:putative prefoldin subunit 1 [Smittium culicis]|uniref:Putative prefoldin subunit 1 n=1 Tax=Smittium culicis TaxID=133412 RepID=A0A1R1X2Y4_9FUNG|nr:putative prefoldin subunit 1 [Smittium culicis]